ncbi:MAG: hypothetical protein L0216_20745 [Planctomycetales bacterium]|nr:hypothetical protein [Planctomycetales bacterium]
MGDPSPSPPPPDPAQVRRRIRRLLLAILAAWLLAFGGAAVAYVLPGGAPAAPAEK